MIFSYIGIKMSLIVDTNKTRLVMAEPKKWDHQFEDPLQQILSH